jgi:integrase
MASVRKRTWKSGSTEKTAWVADYFDQNGKRHQQAFPTKRAADAFLVQARGEVAKGIHTPFSTSITVGEACQLWLERCEGKKLSRSTLTNYRRMIKHHIVPLIGREKLSQLTLPMIEGYCDELLNRKRSHYTTYKALVALKAVLDEARRRGLVAQNVAEPVRVHGDGRNRRKIGIGIDVPSAEDVHTLMDHAGTSLRPLLVTAIFTGMRTGELRGLTWENVDFKREVIVVVNTLREWRLICPRRERLMGFWTPEHKVFEIAKLLEANPGISLAKVARQLGVCTSSVSRVRRAMPISSNSRLWFVFPSQLGNTQAHSSIWAQLGKLQRRVGMVGPDGKPKYSMHAFRHFCASWLIKNGYPLKALQVILGHANAAMTLDTYGHLFVDLDDAHARFAASENALLGVTRLQQKSLVLQHQPDNMLKTLD